QAHPVEVPPAIPLASGAARSPRQYPDQANLWRGSDAASPHPPGEDLATPLQCGNQRATSRLTLKATNSFMQPSASACDKLESNRRSTPALAGDISALAIPAGSPSPTRNTLPGSEIRP